MRCQIIILFIFLVRWNLIEASQVKENRYEAHIEHHFKQQSFDTCLFFQYLLTHKHFNEHDSINLVKDWYFTAWLNVLQGKYMLAKAAKTLADKYAVRRANSLEDIYVGLLFYKQGAYKKALPYLRNAAKSQIIEYPYVVKLAKIFSVNAEAEIKGPEKGITEVEKLLRDIRSDNDTAWFGYALAQKYLGIYLYNKNRCLASLKVMEDAVNTYERFDIYNNDWIECYKFIMNVSWFAGRMDLCDAYFWRLNRLLPKINSELLPYYHYLKGNFMYKKNQFKEAINIYSNVFSNINTLPKDNYYAFYNMLQSYFNLGQYDKVIEWYERLKPDVVESIKILLAYSYNATGNKQKSFRLIKQIRRSYKYDDPYSWYFLGSYYFQLKANKEVEYCYKKYLAQVLQTYGQIGYFSSFAKSALAYFYWYGKSDYKKSLYYYHQEINSLVTTKYCNDYYKLPDVTKSINDEALSKALNNKAEALYEVSKQRKNKAEALRDLQASLANLELSMEVARRFKMTIASDEKKYAFTNAIQHRYSYVVKVCLELYQKTGDRTYLNKAFEYTEKSKAATLLATIRGVDAYKMRLIPDSLKEFEDKLWKQTEFVSFNLIKQYDASKSDLNIIDKLTNELYSLKRQEDNLIRVYKQKYPAYYSAKFDNDVIGLGQLQKKLKPNEVLLQYSLSSDRIVIFCLSSKELKVFNDSITPAFYADMQYYWKFTAQYSDYNCLDTAVRSFEKRSNALYNALIKPVEPYIEGKHLIVIPDGPLAQISFDALVSKVNNCRYFQCMSFLIKENPITYEYSATLYALTHGDNHIKNTRLLAMAPTYDNKKIRTIHNNEWKALDNDSNKIITIPGAFEEAENICKSFNGKAIIKNRATEEKFKSIAGNYDILHLAMHGVANNEIPMLSKLVFTPANDSVNEGLLNTYEIYDLKINAQMVVLSACNTGAGKLYKGEGVISMARAFFSSGAKSVVMTLWPVGDKTSSNLLSIFYKRLASRENIEDALRQAKIDYLGSVDGVAAHPGFWAGYIVSGNSEIVFEAHKTKKKPVLWIALTISMALILLLFRKRGYFYFKRFE